MRPRSRRKLALRHDESGKFYTVIRDDSTLQAATTLVAVAVCAPAPHRRSLSAVGLRAPAGSLTTVSIVIWLTFL